MTQELWTQIIEEQEVRQNLSKLRRELKQQGAASVWRVIAGSEEKLTALLYHEDAKTRKNAALLMGDLGRQEFMELIYKAYEEEPQRFVKSAYLAAMKNFDYREYMPVLKNRLHHLSAMSAELEEQKHLTEELRELSALVLRMEGVKPHSFVSFRKPYEIILLCSRNNQDVTKNQLMECSPGAEVKAFGAGIMAKVNDLTCVNQIRTFQEMLFVVKGMKNCPQDAEKAAEVIVSSELLTFLSGCHDGKAPFYFRVEYKSKKPLDQRGDFVKKLSAQIEKNSERMLINTTSNYEFEIRLIDNKAGTCNILVKLYTLRDERFSYRKQFLPTSIKPVNAALTAALAKEYLKEDGQVLDPFCGVGTMLIERHKVVRANTSYGIDIQEEAIEKARQNTEAAHQVCHYINRNFFDFTHEYLFDEIITDMPFKIGRKTEEDIREVYEQFFRKVSEVMKPDGKLILYSHNEEMVKELAAVYGFPILAEYEISKKEGSYVLILEMQSHTTSTACKTN